MQLCDCIWGVRMADFDSSTLAADQPLPDCAGGSTTNGLTVRIKLKQRVGMGCLFWFSISHAWFGIIRLCYMPPHRLFWGPRLPKQRWQEGLESSKRPRWWQCSRSWKLLGFYCMLACKPQQRHRHSGTPCLEPHGDCITEVHAAFLQLYIG